MDHSIHILLIVLQVLISLTFLLRKKINGSFLIVFLLLFSLSFYSSSARLIFAHHHESQSQTSDHPCCQPLVANFVSDVNFNLGVEEINFKVSEKISLAPFIFINDRSIRGPPNTTS